jgi:hypothetical protein
MHDLSYTNTSCCDQTRNVDQMLDRFGRDRYNVLNQLIEDPDQLANILWDLSYSPLSIDRKCLCQMGTTYNQSIVIGPEHDDRIIKGMFRCAQCRNLNRLIDFKTNPVDRPFLIECGNLTGKKMIIRQQDVDELSINVTLEPQSLVQYLLNQHKNLSICQPSISNSMELKYLMSDSFTNEMLITWLLDSQFEEIGLPHINRLYTAYICRDHGYKLYEHHYSIQELSNVAGLANKLCKSSESRTPLCRETVLGIIQQLIVTLKILSIFDTTHGSASTQSLLFENKPCSYRFEETHVQCPVTLKVTNFSRASMSIQSAKGPIRLFSKEDQGSGYLSKFPFIPKIQTTVHIPFDCHDGICANQSKRYTTFTLDGETSNILEAARYSGVPLFASAFDAYSFLVALMMEQSFYLTVINDPYLKRLWESCFLSRERDIINERIVRLHQYDEISTQMIIAQLTGLHLRCDMVDYLWEQLRTKM